MPNKDVKYDYTPPQTLRPARGPSISQLAVAIAGSPVSAKYPVQLLETLTKLDLLNICRVEGIAVTGD